MADPYVAYAEACEASGSVPLAHVLENMSQAPLGVIDARGYSGGVRVSDADCGPLGEAMAASGTTAFYASNNEIGDAAACACSRRRGPVHVHKQTLPKPQIGRASCRERV